MTNLNYLYTYTFHHDEDELCQMEMRAFFNAYTTHRAIKSSVKIDPSRSPFMDYRMDIHYEAETLEQLAQQVATLQLGNATFKVQCLNTEALGDTEKIGYNKRREYERTIGLAIVGEPEFEQPDALFGLALYEGIWHFGPLHVSESVWRHHVKKPHMYSTALSTRVARGVANIAVPFVDGVKAIDPCCGIGTVLVEARSMGIDMAGRDINPLVVYGSRKNLRHFNYNAEDVNIGPIAEAQGEYDVAVIDMPYNLFTHITKEEQADIIKAARHITKKIVIVTIEPMDEMITEAGFTIIDRCKAKKGSFAREVLLCQ